MSIHKTLPIYLEKFDPILLQMEVQQIRYIYNDLKYHKDSYLFVE